MADKVHTFEEVAKHNQKEDCWLIIWGKVYDVTSFLEEHPGGDDALLAATGKDATYAFEDVGHSDDAQMQMKNFLIGHIDKSTLPIIERDFNVGGTTITGAATENQSSGEDSSKILLFVLPLLILGAAFLLRIYSQKE